MSDDNDFPKLDGGWCDGLGCGGFCWCGEHLAMKEEFQRTYNKPWKESYDEDSDIDCDRVAHLYRFSTDRVEKYYKNEVQKLKDEISRHREQLSAHIVVYPKDDGTMGAKRCKDWGAASAFIRENDFTTADCKVIGGGWILTQDSGQMWYYKRAEQK